MSRQALTVRGRTPAELIRDAEAAGLDRAPMVSALIEVIWRLLDEEPTEHSSGRLDGPPRRAERADPAQWLLQLLRARTGTEVESGEAKALAMDAGFSARTLQRAFAKLSEAGLVICTRRKGFGKESRTVWSLNPKRRRRGAK